MTGRPSPVGPDEHAIEHGGLRFRIRSTGVSDGDFAVTVTDDASRAALEARRRAIVDAPWTWLRQVHGNTVVRVDEPGQHAGVTADGALTSRFGVPIAVTTADCAPVVLVADTAVAVVHAGWRGALAGIVERAADQLLEAGGRPVACVLGPCIGPADYEFGIDDLDRIAAVYGDGVRSSTADGRPALDLATLVGAACRRAGWPTPGVPPSTADPRWFSHRTRGDRGRQTTVAWIEPLGDRR